jgi:hypothetical protein
MGCSMGHIGRQFKMRRDQGLARKRQENGVFQYFDRTRTFSVFDRWLGAQGLFDPIEMSATMHRTPQDARLPTYLDLRHHLR